MCDHKYNITIHLHPPPIPPFYSFPRNTHKYTKPALRLLCVDVHWSWAAKWSQTMSRAATSLTPFTNRQHSLGAGPTVTLRRRYSSYLALFVSLYSFFFFTSRFPHRPPPSRQLLSPSDLLELFEFNRLALQFWKKEKGNGKNLFMWKKRKIKLLEGCLSRGHHGNPYQPNPFNVNASSSVTVLSKACRGQKKSCSVCALSG